MNDSAYKLDRWIHRDLEEFLYPEETEHLNIVEPTPPPEPLAFLPTPADTDPNAEPVYLRPPSPETHTAIFRAEGDNTPITSLCPWTETPVGHGFIVPMFGEQDRKIVCQKLYVKMSAMKQRGIWYKSRRTEHQFIITRVEAEN
jgi:hypothetical protein